MEQLAILRQFCDEQQIGPIRPNLCEDVYINHVYPGDANESVIDCMQQVLAGVSFHPNECAPTPELVTYNRVYTLDDCKGRLYVEAGIGSRREGKVQKDVVVLKITARVVPCEGDELSVALQRAHDAVIDGFVSVTSSDAKRNRWGYQNGG